MTTPLPSAFFSALADFAGGKDTPRDLLERCLARLEHAQEVAAHESPRTTKLYDRTKERRTQDEVERIRL
jgi:hypothetical protein